MELEHKVSLESHHNDDDQSTVADQFEGSNDLAHEYRDDASLRMRLKDLSLDEFSRFFNAINGEEGQPDLSQETADVLFDRYLDAIEIAAAKSAPKKTVESAQDRYVRHSNARQEFILEHPMLGMSRPDYEQLSIGDKMLRSMVERLKCPKDDYDIEAISDIVELTVEQDQHMIRPDVFYDALADINWLPNLDRGSWDARFLSRIKGGFLGAAFYDMAFFFDRFQGYFEDRAQKAEGDPVGQAKLLELTRLVTRSQSFHENYDDGMVYEGLSRLVTSLAESTDSYLVRQRAADVMRDMEHGDAWIESGDKNADNPVVVGMEKLDYLQREGYSAHVLSPRHVGIYSKGGVLERFVLTDDLRLEDRPLLRQLADLHLFAHEPKDAHEADQKSALVQDFLFLSSLPIREAIERDFGVDLGSLDIRVQNYFLNYLKNNSEDQVRELARYAQEYGSDFFTTFLSMEDSQDMGERIVQICQKLEPEEVKAVLAKYGELFEATEQVRDYLGDNFGDQLKDNQELEDAIIENLLKKGKEVLVYAAERDDQGFDIRTYLEGVKTELVLFSNTFRALKESGESVDLEQFRAIHIEHMSGVDLPESVKGQLLALCQANWKGQGKEGEKVIEEFNSLLDSPDLLEKSRFYMVQHDDDVLGFFRLDEESDASLYLGSVNARPDLRGTKIGETLLDQVFTVAAQGRVVRAHCNPKSPITTKYIGKLGFVATDITDYVQEGDTFDIVRDDRPERRQDAPGYAFRGKSYEELVGMESDVQGGSQGLLRRYVFPGDYLLFTEEARHLLHQEPKIVITAYQREKKPQEDGSYQVVVGFEYYAPPVPAVSTQEAMLAT